VQSKVLSDAIVGFRGGSRTRAHIEGRIESPSSRKGKPHRENRKGRKGQIMDKTRTKTGGRRWATPGLSGGVPTGEKRGEKNAQDYFSGRSRGQVLFE